jgi:hypothetical protein
MSESESVLVSVSGRLPNNKGNHGEIFEPPPVGRTPTPGPPSAKVGALIRGPSEAPSRVSKEDSLNDALQYRHCARHRMPACGT